MNRHALIPALGPDLARSRVPLDRPAMEGSHERRKHNWPWFWPLEPEDVKRVKTITIQSEDGSEAGVDDDRNWFADDEAVFDAVPRHRCL